MFITLSNIMRLGLVHIQGGRHAGTKSVKADRKGQRSALFFSSVAWTERVFKAVEESIMNSNKLKRED